jgi:hypothetical protein
LGPVLIDEVHFAVGISKIPNLNIRTEPEIDENNGQDDLITDPASYEKIRSYIFENQKYLQTDTVGLNSKTQVGSYKIVVNGKNIFYLRPKNSKNFFERLYKVLREGNADDRIATQMIKDDYK